MRVGLNSNVSLVYGVIPFLPGGFRDSGILSRRGTPEQRRQNQRRPELVSPLYVSYTGNTGVTYSDEPFNGKSPQSVQLLVSGLPLIPRLYRVKFL